MISILIPVFNFDVNELVNTLVAQCNEEDIAFEILCYEDGSTAEMVKTNRAISNNNHVKHKVFEQNLGRSKIRNTMTQDAKYNWVIFMDCDSMVETESYISRYLKVIDNNKPCVVFGGRTYDEIPPKNEQKKLRWLYGKNREVFLPITRSERPYKFFMTNNFLAHKEILKDIPFNEDLVGYGHEDTVFAQDLKRASITVLHIDNPLRHIGLENSDEFLIKTEEGIKNLVYLNNQGLITEDNRLLETFNQLKKMKLHGFIKNALKLIHGFLKSRLVTNKPSLMAFDLFKLSLFLHYKSLR